MSKSFGVIIALSIIAMLSLGALLHASLPHSHPHNPVAIDLLHTAAHPGTKDAFALIVFGVPFLFLLVSYLGQILPARVFTAYALRARAFDAYLTSLRRGIESHRRFG